VFRHDWLVSGEIWYVSPAGHDANSGISPDDPLLTISRAETLAAAGDMIVTAAGTYAEAVDLSKDSLQFMPEIGTIIAPVAGVPLTLSGEFIRVLLPGGALLLEPPALSTGLLVTGDNCYIGDFIVDCATIANIGVDMQGRAGMITNARCVDPVATAYRLAGDVTHIRDSTTGGTAGGTSIGFLVTAAADKVRLINCGSDGHIGAGFQIDAGVTSVVVKNCVSGALDGRFIDLGTNTFLDLIEYDQREYHEEVYPSPDGEGTGGDAVTVQSQINDETGATNVQNYWGDVATVLAPSVVTAGWFWKGINLFATSAGHDQRFRFYRVVSEFTGARNGGNNWDEGATDLTLTDAAEAAQFLVGDLVWIRSPGYQPNGEIVEVTNVVGPVLTIARNVESSGRTGLHWDHTTNDPGNEELYLCYRDDPQYHTMSMDYSASGPRDFSRHDFLRERRMEANDGVICRMINGTNSLNSQCSVTLIWSD
jgi:hypothetical protein